MTRVLVTGGAGFIGSHLCDRMLERTDWEIVILDKLTYASSMDFLENALANPRCRFVKGDIADRELLASLFREFAFDRVANLAAESHVDRSIDNPEDFIQSNIVGAYRLLEEFRRLAASRPDCRFLQVSTDEVYGSIPGEGAADENAPLLPNSPYSASKAAADLLARAYFQTYGLHVTVTRTSNNFGPRQNREKMIPTIIRSALENRPVPVYGDGRYFRDWIYVSDHCDGIIAALDRGKGGEIYNFGGSKAIGNLELVRIILARLGKPPDRFTFVKDRPGHDRRYAIDSGKAWRELGVRPEVGFDEGMERTLAWYRGLPSGSP